MTELKEIAGHPGYFLDTDGTAYTSWTQGSRGQFGRHISDLLRQLRGSRTGHGYILISFGRAERRYLHHLMLETFAGPRPYGMEACHENDVPNDNRLSNLYWGTPSQNNGQDRRRNGTANLGERHGFHKLSNADVQSIRDLRGIKTQFELATLYSVHPNTIYLIQRRKTWSHLEPQECCL